MMLTEEGVAHDQDFKQMVTCTLQVRQFFNFRIVFPNADTLPPECSVNVVNIIPWYKTFLYQSGHVVKTILLYKKICFY